MFCEVGSCLAADFSRRLAVDSLGAAVGSPARADRNLIAFGDCSRSEWCPVCASTASQRPPSTSVRAHGTFAPAPQPGSFPKQPAHCACIQTRRAPCALRFRRAPARAPFSRPFGDTRLPPASRGASRLRRELLDLARLDCCPTDNQQWVAAWRHARGPTPPRRTSCPISSRLSMRRSIPRCGAAAVRPEGGKKGGNNERFFGFFSAPASETLLRAFAPR